VECRTTGGGQLIQGYTVGVNATNGTGTNAVICIPQITTLFPTQSATGLLLEKITHGGQLGAPFSQSNCASTTNSLGAPCIWGQWEHQRHYQGQGHPRDVIDSFHAGNPKGLFDTLKCACLPCCPDDTNDKNGPNGNFTGHDKFEICNKEDHRVCGPQPRPAPANALIWTGLARSTPWDDVKGANAKNAQWVVVRVYIEDRSEPGGGHPGGSINPADIYSFQAWYTGVSVAKGPQKDIDFDLIASDLRIALSQQSCAFLEALKTGALPIGSLPPNTVSVGGAVRPAIIWDKGPLYDGNRQIHPATSAICIP
jgi:hypothetical protein